MLCTSTLSDLLGDGMSHLLFHIISPYAAVKHPWCVLVQYDVNSTAQFHVPLHHQNVDFEMTTRAIYVTGPCKSKTLGGIMIVYVAVPPVLISFPT